MQIRFAFLCDYADQPGNGKLNALGIGFDNVFCSDLEVPIHPFCLVIQLEGARSEAGTKQLDVHLMDADGKEVVPPMRGKIQIGAPPSGLKIGAGLVINYNNVRFPAYGLYNFSVVVDGTEMVSLPLTLSQPPKTR